MRAASAVTNFGANITFRPASAFAPETEAEVLEVLRTHAGRRFRAMGRLHSWSELTVCDDVLLDLQHLNEVTIHAEGPTPWVEVGAGCQIKRLIRVLNRAGHTLPTLGLIDEQSVAGAIATGTHGSGRSSLSHYVLGMRIARFGGERSPNILDISTGPELQAARCSLGCLGIVTAVRLPIRPQYRIEEHFHRHTTLEEVLRAESTYPLQQTFLLPWRWEFFAQHRRETDQPASRHVVMHRLFWAVGMDLALHLVIRMLARHLPFRFNRFLYRRILPNIVPRNWPVVDRSDRQLTMNHALFRHIEIEIFVARSRLADAMPFVIWLLRHLAGERVVPSDYRRRLESVGLWNEIELARGVYAHHYPICIRKVLPDDTLLSMASGDEPRYALSFISYARPDQRAGFRQFARLIARSMAMLFDARPHWGKVCPLASDELQRLYPGFGEFEEVRRQLDADGAFANEWVRRIFSFIGSY